MPTAIRSQHSFWLRLCALNAFLLGLCWAPRAFAAVPMCGSHAQTVAAPPIGTPASDDAVRGEPCREQAPLGAAGAPNRDAPQASSLPDAPVRALPVLPRGVLAARATRQPRRARERNSMFDGFARSIDRPPRA